MIFILNSLCMEKIAVNLKQLKKATTALKSKLIRRPIGFLSDVKRFSMSPNSLPVGMGLNATPTEKNLANYLKVISPVQKKMFNVPYRHIDKQLLGKIYQHKGGFSGDQFIKNIIKGKKNKEVLNRIGILHEGFELRAKPLGEFSSHVSPEVILKEHNILKTLPKRYIGAKQTLQSLRFETYGFPETIPGFAIGESPRLSRHAIKRLSPILMKKYKNFVINTKRSATRLRNESLKGVE